MSDYQISIVTPFHNVELDLFEQAFASMKKQTIGFENIEWIIVVHNCEPHYMPVLSEMLGTCPNVILHELNNDARTASSPRNCGIRLATAPYIGFLDGDDSYTTDCLETAVREITNAKAQIVLFRMEYELADAFSTPVPDIVLWNQCRERIVIERDSWDYEKMFSGMFGWVTSRVFDRAFMVENDLYFDEDLVLFEDFHMLFRAFEKVDRLVYLPQTIGYHYMINGGSTLQSRKSGETLVRYAIGLKKLYEAIENAGIISDFVQRSCLMLCSMILRSEDITEAQRLEIKELLGPFVEKFELFPANKLRSPEVAELYCSIPREVILHTEKSLDAVHLMESIDGIYALASILRKNAETDFGRAHRFKDIASIEEYRTEVALMQPKDLTKLVRLQTNIGEAGILTKDKVTRYFVNAFHEYIPSVDEHFYTYLQAFSGMMEGKTNLLLAYRDDSFGFTNDHAMIGELQSMLVMEYFTRIYLTGRAGTTNFSSNVGLYFSDHQGTKKAFYLQLMKDALLRKDIEQITAMSTKEVLTAFNMLEKNAAEILQEIDRTDPARADEIRAVLSQGFEEPVAGKLWPELERIVAFGAGELSVFTAKMKRYTGDIPHNNGFYFTEEAILGHAVADDSDLLEKALVSEDFFELLSLTDNQVVLLSEAQIDKPYQVIITGRSGLYRYTTQHFIRVKEKNNIGLRYTIY